MQLEKTDQGGNHVTHDMKHGIPSKHAIFGQTLEHTAMSLLK